MFNTTLWLIIDIAIGGILLNHKFIYGMTMMVSKVLLNSEISLECTLWYLDIIKVEINLENVACDIWMSFRLI